MRGIIVKSIATLLGVAMLFSCKPDLKTIETITAKQGNLPVETASDMKIVYSTHGQIQMTMQAPFMQRFQGENPYMELPDGFVMVFFDSLMNETSRISAKYAIQYEEDQLIDARNDVVVENIENNEKLNTEQLIWDQKNERIYTEKFVKITTSDEVLYGDGFESDERFTSWEIKNPRGTFYVETGEEQEEELPTQQIDTLASPQ
ncbi:MAG: LPS export ABC transporter periplasmic protein LptC [Bacteroidota bacterium]